MIDTATLNRGFHSTEFMSFNYMRIYIERLYLEYSTTCFSVHFLLYTPTFPHSTADFVHLGEHHRLRLTSGGIPLATCERIPQTQRAN